jgi:hypothetical protein
MSGWRPFGKVILGDVEAWRVGCSHVSGLRVSAAWRDFLMVLPWGFHAKTEASKARQREGYTINTPPDL